MSEEKAIVAVQVFETVEHKIANDLKKFDPNEANIQKAVAEVSNLTIAGLDDKEGYKALERGALLIKKMRTGIEKTRKECKEESLIYGRAIDAYAKKLTERLAPAEEAAKAKLQAIDLEKERIELERLEKEYQQTKERVATIQATGAAFDGVNYSLAEKVISYSEVKLMSDEDFVLLNSSFQAIAIREAQTKANNERIAREAEEQRQADIKAKQERLSEQKRLQDVEAARLQEERTEIERQKAEMQAAKDAATKQMLAARGKELEALGMSIDHLAGQYYYKTQSFGDVTVGLHLVLESNDEQWPLALAKVSTDIALIKQKQADFDLKQQQAAEAIAKQKKEYEEANNAFITKDKANLLVWMKAFRQSFPIAPTFESLDKEEDFGDFMLSIEALCKNFEQSLK